MTTSFAAGHFTLALWMDELNDMLDLGFTRQQQHLMGEIYLPVKAAPGIVMILFGLMWPPHPQSYAFVAVVASLVIEQVLEPFISFNESDLLITLVIGFMIIEATRGKDIAKFDAI